jgi:serine/threonine protein phosphatase PrpC
MDFRDAAGGNTNARTAEMSSGFRFEAAAVTDVGRQRKHNEDNVLLRAELDLFAVADGMGGHNAGDVASKLAAISLRNFFEAVQAGDVPALSLPPGYEGLTVDAQRLAAAIRKANRDVFEISSTQRQHQGMGSTLVACHLARDAGTMHIGHVGDSRCYRLRNGTLEQLTRDHSLVNDALAMKPDLTPEELARLPKNIITRALGMRDEVKVDIRSETVASGDLYLLCSDGLSGLVSEPVMAETMASVHSAGIGLRDVCERLIILANEAGGNDNISALLIRIDADDAVDEESPDEADDVVAVEEVFDDAGYDGAARIEVSPRRSTTAELEVDVDFTDEVSEHPTPSDGLGLGSQFGSRPSEHGLERPVTREFDPASLGLGSIHLDEVTPATRTCRACRAVVDVRNAFCPSCGQAMSS